MELLRRIKEVHNSFFIFLYHYLVWTTGVEPVSDDSKSPRRTASHKSRFIFVVGRPLYHTPSTSEVIEQPVLILWSANHSVILQQICQQGEARRIFELPQIENLLNAYFNSPNVTPPLIIRSSFSHTSMLPWLSSYRAVLLHIYGAPPWNRTKHTRLFRPLLYLLS